MKFIACKLTDTDKWQKVITVGKWSGHKSGEFELSIQDLHQIVENFKRLGLDIPVDYEHQTLLGTKAPASGWIKHPHSLEVRGDALFAKIEWTKEAKKRIEKKEYRYLSPTIIAHATDPKSGEDIGWLLHSVALTNTPFFNELPPIAAKHHTTTQEEKVEELKKLQKENTQLKDELKELKEQNKKMKEFAAKSKIEAAIASGKLTDEQKTWAMRYALSDPDGFDAYLETIKPKKEIPEDNIFAASNKPNDEAYDLTKI